MNTRYTLYELLRVDVGASTVEIKTAFRRLAKLYHPDRNDNSPESAATFRTLHNAYTILIDPATRKAYDRFLGSSSVFGGTGYVDQSTRQTRGVSVLPDPKEAVYLVVNHLNYILWDIEELIRQPRVLDRVVAYKPLSEWINMLLAFIDRWVLETCGFQDYFFQARRIDPRGLTGGMNGSAGDLRSDRYGLTNSGLPPTHKPYVNLEDYFYDIRRRTDRLIGRMKLVELFKEVPGKNLRILDCIFETHNYCMYYLGWIQKSENEGADIVPPFRHSNAVFGQ